MARAQAIPIVGNDAGDRFPEQGEEARPRQLGLDEVDMGPSHMAGKAAAPRIRRRQLRGGDLIDLQQIEEFGDRLHHGTINIQIDGLLKRRMLPDIVGAGSLCPRSLL
jgi:hypothetical protein